MTAAACTGEPISWPRLEQFAAGAADHAIAAHLAGCPACARCLAELRDDVVVLPPLALPERAGRRRWWLALAPALAVAALALVLWRDGGGDRSAPGAPADEVTAVKGVGEVVLGLVRERDGTVRDDVATFAAGDRWKVVVTCPPGAGAWIDVAVIDAGMVDHPLPPARIACGNRVVVPGAFALTSDRPNRICIRVAGDAGRDRDAPRAGEPGVACVTVRPE